MSGSEIFAAAKKNRWFLCCLAIVLALGLVYIAAGEDIVVEAHDQLDGEVLTYVLHAKHLGADAYPELMNGIPAEGMQMAAPGMLALYLLFPAATAFAVGYALIMLVAYVGMYLLNRSFAVRTWVASVVALTFALLPFYSVYGLSVMGLPLFFSFVKRLWDGQARTDVVRAILAAVVLGLFSSLVLSGFAVLLVLVVLSIASAVRGNRRRVAYLLVVCAVLFGVYMVENWGLVTQILGTSGYESHKSERVLSPSSATVKDVVDFLVGGQYHAASNHRVILVFALVALVIGTVGCARVYRGAGCRGTGGEGAATALRLTKTLAACLAFACFIAVFYVAFRSEAIVSLRSGLPGSLKAFQLDRIYWLYPTIWYLAFGVAAELLLTILARRVLCVCVCAACALVAAATLVASGASCAPVQTAKAELGGDIGDNITWADFFGEDLFEQIEASLDVDKASTRVISIGLYPSIAAYNGWYCLDAYSNNYPLEYKHEFREIIAGELACDDSLATYFDAWGNRCYVFSHELGRNYLVGKTSGIALKDVRIDVAAAKSMGCGYVFSSVEICNSDDFGLEQVGRFDAKGVPYEVWVYTVE